MADVLLGLGRLSPYKPDKVVDAFGGVFIGFTMVVDQINIEVFC